jgi:predicted hydrocarbon binding protein
VPGESLEKGLVLAGLEALRQIGGEALVQVLLDQAGAHSLATFNGDERVPIEEYLKYRDTALEFLQDSFCTTAFETGRILVRRLGREREGQVRALLAQFEHAANKLPVIGQAAVLAAKGNPGSVRAAMRGDALVITIENCPECRNLRREAPFCYLNQGIITEFAETHLGMRVRMEETKCMALGERSCEITASVAS